MAVQLIDATSETPDTLREGAAKINDNFAQLVGTIAYIQRLICSTAGSDQTEDAPKLQMSVGKVDLDFNNPVVGDLVYFNTTQFGRAQAELSDKQEILGMITSQTDTHVYITLDGVIDVLTGLTPGAQYYLSPDNAGQYVEYSDIANCEVIKPVFTAVSATKAIFNIQQGSLKGLNGAELYEHVQLSTVIEFNEVTGEVVTLGEGRPIRNAESISFDDIEVSVDVLVDNPTFINNQWSMHTMMQVADEAYAEVSIEPGDISLNPLYNLRVVTGINEVAAEVIVEA